VVVGPTAVGKTAVAIALAAHLPVEVISADSRQIYRRLDIGTAKPTHRERARVPHHGLDVVEPGIRYSAGQFARDAARWVEEIRNRGRLPLVEAGPGFFEQYGALIDQRIERKPLQHIVGTAAFGVAEKDGSLDRFEDELFRFGRILDREPELSRLPSDTATPVDKRVALLREVLTDHDRGVVDGLVDRVRSALGGDDPVSKVAPVTATLLEQVVRNPRSRNLDVAAEELSELAAARRDRYVAHVRTPVRMTGEQEQRLTDSLTRLYGRPISLQVELDPDLLGGLVVRVGGELIDGSVAGRLAAARRALPS